MKKYKHKRKKIVLIIILIIIFFIAFQPTIIKDSERKFERKCSVYSWNMEDINYEELETISRELKINSFYQYTKKEKINSYEFANLLENLYLMGVNLYILAGAPSYAYDDEINNMKNIIDEVAIFNNNNEHKISGIVFDVEFYLEKSRYNLDTKEECFKIYYNNMKKAYEYAKSKEIKIALVIPYWLDTEFGENELEKIIKNTCDSVEVMNYYKNKSIEHIENEVKYAKKYDKEIVTVSELQDESVVSIVPEVTFYGDGIEACKEDMEKILKEYKYDKLGYAYHYYKYLKILHNQHNNEL